MQLTSQYGARRRSRAAVATGLALTGALALSACAGGSAEEPATPPSAEIVPGGIVNVGISGDPGILDPTFANTLTSVSVFNSMCELLYNVNADGVVFPQLAAAMPEFNDEGDVATIALREGVLFADGTPMDADAVKFSLDRHKTTEGSQRSGELASVEEVVVVDEQTIQVNLVRPLAPGAFSVIFTDRAGTIVSPTAVEELGADFEQAPVCVGPFAFESRIAQDSVTLTKDPNYYAADQVNFDGVVYRVIPDTAVRATNLQSGDLDVSERIATTDLATLEANPGIAIESFAGLGHLNMIFNIGNSDGVTNPPGVVDTPLATDPRIRMALAMSIDRDAINTAVYNGAYEPACGFMAPSSELVSEASQTCIPYDPEAARELLESTGVEIPFAVEYLAANIPEYRRLGEVIQQMAAEAGFEVVLNLNESTATVDLSYSGNFEIYLNSWSGRIDPDANIATFAASTSPRAVSKYSNSRVDEILIEARAEADPEVRAELYGELQSILNEDVPFIYLVRPVNLIGHATDVAGLEYRPNGGTVLTNAGFTSAR